MPARHLAFGHHSPLTQQHSSPCTPYMDHHSKFRSTRTQQVMIHPVSHTYLSAFFWAFSALRFALFFLFVLFLGRFVDAAFFFASGNLKALLVSDCPPFLAREPFLLPLEESPCCLFRRYHTAPTAAATSPMNKGVCVEEVFTDFFFLHASRVTMTILRLKTMSCHQRTSSVYYLRLAFLLPNT